MYKLLDQANRSALESLIRTVDNELGQELELHLVVLQRRLSVFAVKQASGHESEGEVASSRIQRIGGERIDPLMNGIRQQQEAG